MGNLNIQLVLRQGTSLTKLKEDYGIVSKQSSVNAELYLFKYDQIRSDMSLEIVQECRGLILNKEDNWNIVCFPYTKFFNYLEPHSATLNWDCNITAFKKLDGTLVNLYWYKGWRFSTSGNPDAEGPCLNNSGKQTTFNQLIKEVWDKYNYHYPFNIDRDRTFMFELCTPLNKVVVQHKESYILLHGVRDNNTGKELNVFSTDVHKYNWGLCPSINFFSISQIQDYIKRIDPLLEEGLVLVDKDFNRVKFKSSAYVALHHIKSSMSFRSMLNIIRLNECPEFLLYFPEYQEFYNSVNNKLSALKYHINTLISPWLERKNQGEELSRKEVGLYFKDNIFQGMMFPLLFDDKNLDDLLRDMSINKLEKWLDNYE
jgi:hypothetical protein